MDMRLARLVNLEEDKLKAELNELIQIIDNLSKILASKTLQNDVIKKELLEIKKSFGSPRKSHILKNADVKICEVDNQVSSSQNYILALTAGGTIKKVTVKNYSMSNKSLNDSSSLTDVHTQIIEASSSDTVLVFSNMGNVLKISVDKIKECKWRDPGFSMNQLDNSSLATEKPVKILISGKANEILFFSKKAMIKRSTLADTLTQKSYYQALKIQDKDELLNVEYLMPDTKVLMLSESGMSLCFDPTEVPLQGRISIGVKGINIEDGDTLIFAGLILKNNSIITVSSDGFVKKIECEKFPLASRYRKGLKYFSLANNSKVIFASSDNISSVLAVDFGLKILPLETKKFKASERLSSGEPIIKKKFLGVYAFC